MLHLDSLTWRNTMETIKREPVYFFTMIVVEALMLAFDSMLFSKDVQKICEQGFIMDILIGFVTIFITIIITWLIHYMMCQAFKLRSKEFSLYMLCGVKQRKLFRMYIKETMLMAGSAYVFGLVLGMLLKQFLMVVFYHMFRLDYTIEMDFHFQVVVLTAVEYFFCYFIALIKIKKKFIRLSIRQLNELERDNDKVKLSKSHINTRLLLANDRLFIWRSVEAEIVSMKKILFFVTVLLMISILGSTIAMMYTDYENNQIDAEYPFDLMVYHETPNLNFEREKNILNYSVGIKFSHEYIIYQNKSRYMNEWLYTHLNYFGNKLMNKDGKFDRSKLDSEADYNVYYTYDTYMKESDYNILLKMLGEKEITLKPNEYLLQIKRRLEPELTNSIRNRTIKCGNNNLHCKRISTVDFEQNGHNGADYIFVIPDEVVHSMEPYYSVMTAITKKPVSSNISEKLTDSTNNTGEFRYGSNHSILYTSPILAKKEIEITLKSTVTAVLFPFAYVSLVFLCVAISLLAAHLMSTTDTNRKRYNLLKKIGMTQKEIDIVIHKQLAIDYLIPLAVALIPSWIMSSKMSMQFILDTGLRTNFDKYICLSLLWILTVYIIYFIMTDVFFRRDIQFRREG